MNFEFENGDDNVEATLAFAVYKDDAICTTYSGKPLSIYAMTQVLGMVISSSLSKSGEFPSWVNRRDEVHRIARTFCRAMKADPTAAIWESAEAETPDCRKILFTIKGNKEVRKGIYDKKKLCYISDKGIQYRPEEVAYWTPCPVAPVETDDEVSLGSVRF